MKFLASCNSKIPVIAHHLAGGGWWAVLGVDVEREEMINNRNP